MEKRKVTKMAVDTDFFMKVFEPARKKKEKELGITLSQPKFTKLLSTSGFKMDFKLDKKLTGGKRGNAKSFRI
jgi:hypothetical protein